MEGRVFRAEVVLEFKYETADLKMMGSPLVKTALPVEPITVNLLWLIQGLCLGSSLKFSMIVLVCSPP